MPVKNISHIEVIRGPGSMLYGGDATTGVINVVLKTGKSLQGGDVGGFFGSQDTYPLQSAYEHNLSTDYVRGRQPPEKPTLLIIEDDADAAFFAYNALKDSYAIDIASDGESGLDLWNQKRHELVLLDYMLPGIKDDAVLVS